MAKILVVEDDIDLASLVVDKLTMERHTVESANNGQYGWEALQNSVFDLVILDWELPEMTGIEILRRFRSAGGKTLVIMLTGKGDIVDKEQGFDTGADDYLPKPFNMRELELRVKSSLRRTPTAATNKLTADDLVLDTVKHQLTRSGINIHLLPRDFALLEFFMRHSGEIFSSDALLSRVWH